MLPDTAYCTNVMAAYQTNSSQTDTQHGTIFDISLTWLKLMLIYRQRTVGGGGGNRFNGGVPTRADR